MEETIELTAETKADMPDCADGKCGKCDKCMAAKAVEDGEETEEMAKSAGHKCLECGCGIPQDSHGSADVSTAEMVSPNETPKSAEADETPVAEEAPVEVTEEISEAVEAADVTSLEDVVEKAVKSAMESVKAEIDSLRADKEAAVEKSVKLESDLASALSKSVAGGPKRTATKMSDEAQSDLLVKAATCKAKSVATTDPVLAKGYRALHAEFLAKAAPVASN